MGDPKFSRKKYETPSHPWQASRIKEESDLVRKYGLKNKREVWKARSYLRKIRGQARDLIGKQRLDDPQVKRETTGLISRLMREGFLGDEATLDDILALTVEAVLGRRLQTITYLKGLAMTPKQARQLIVHGHVAVSGGRVTIPGHLVTRDEEPGLEYSTRSALQNEAHPVRPQLEAGATQVLAEAPPEPDFRGGGRGGKGGRRQGGGSKPKGGKRAGGAPEGGAR